MKTQGHIITDEQLAQFEELKKRDFETKTKINVTIFKKLSYNDGYIENIDSRGPRGCQDSQSYQESIIVPPDGLTVSQSILEINIQTNDKTKLAQVANEIKNVSVRNFDALQKYYEKYIEPFEQNFARLRYEYKEMVHKKEELMKNPSIWQFLKNRKKHKRILKE